MVSTKVKKNKPSLIIWFSFFLLTACSYGVDITAFPINKTHTTTPQIESQVNQFGWTPTPYPLVTKPENKASKIEMVQTTWYFDREGILHVVGVVQNHSEETLGNILVSIQIQDSGSSVIGLVTVPLSTGLLYPGENGVFFHAFLNVHPSTPQVSAGIVAYDVSGSERIDLEIQNVNVTPDNNGDLHVSGEIFNSNKIPTYIDQVVVAFFDGNGLITSANSRSIGSHYLEPGEVGPFRVSIPLPEEWIEPTAEYTLYIRATRGSLLGLHDLTIESRASHFFDQEGVFHLVTQVTNDSDQPMLPVFLATIYDSSGSVLDVSETTTFGMPLSPGESMFIHFSDWAVLNSGQFASQKVEKYAIQWDPYLTHEAVQDWIHLETQLDIIQIENGNAAIQGSVTNQTSQPIAAYKIIARLWDQSTGNTLAITAIEEIAELLEMEARPFKLETSLPPFSEGITIEITLLAKGKVE
jgi:hypothetical protein